MKKSILLFSGLLCMFQAFAFEKNLLVKENYKSSDITQMNLNLSFEDVSIQKIHGDEITMEIYSNYKKKLPSYELDGSTLKLQTSPKRVFNYDLCKICLYIPEDYKLSTLFINTTSGDIDISYLNAENISIKSASGDVDTDDINCDEDFSILANSGDIDINRINAKTISLKTTSGDIDIEKSKAEDMTLKTTSGNIESDKFEGDYISLETNSGNVDSNNTICNYFTASAISGDITLILKKAPSAASAMKTTSGDIELILPKNEGFDLISSSNSGRLHDEINDMSISIRGEFRNSYYGGGSEITIKTTSGDITIDN